MPKEAIKVIHDIQGRKREHLESVGFASIANYMETTYEAAFGAAGIC